MAQLTINKGERIKLYANNILIYISYDEGKNIYLTVGTQEYDNILVRVNSDTGDITKLISQTREYLKDII